ncbi:MAG: hypothetical protein IIX48_06305 [Lachnospiraceae bacterium]|nr:hypothetical protein [Lachnospiraceae bacterium]
MRNHKNDLIQFLEWMRNGIAFCTTWFLVLVLVFCHFSGIQSILTISLIKMVIWIIGGVFIFNLFFARLIIAKWGFVKRLSCFMVVISIYECLGFYWFDFFTGLGTAIQWFAFVGVILLLYLICIAIYQRYSRQQGEIYTQALQEYQQKRSMENGK